MTAVDVTPQGPSWDEVRKEMSKRIQPRGVLPRGCIWI